MRDEVKTAIGVVLLGDKQIEKWPLKDVRDLHSRIVEAVKNADTWVGLTKKEET
jgi:hypothetical protein